MGLASQGLTKEEKEIFRRLVNAAKRKKGGSASLQRKLSSITSEEVGNNETVKKNIKDRIREEIIDPFRKKIHK